MPKLSIGSWCFLFGQEQPAGDFHVLTHHVQNLGYDGVELGAFAPHPTPESLPTREERQKFARLVTSHGLEFSALVADLWSLKLVSVSDASSYVDAFRKNLQFAEDLGIRRIRIDTAEATATLPRNLDPRLAMDRIAAAFDRCAKSANERGVQVCWEFEANFPLNRPSEIVELARRVRDAGNTNFGVLFDTATAHVIAGGKSAWSGEGETLADGAVELAKKLDGLITHVHLADGDGSLLSQGLPTRKRLGKGKIPLTPLIAEVSLQSPEWMTFDLCFMPDAWTEAAEAKRLLWQQMPK
ncbi:MAG: sugar phosphate isomerase/epimerase [Gemmataceae bacterium]|nr:sugar phosphate isomerase/epimerase [Gemmataceae bacterium]